MEKKYFRLFSSCIPIKGKNKSLIYDLQRNDVYEISNNFCEVIPIIESNKIEDIQNENPILVNFLKKLVNDEIGFFCDDPTQFPKLSNKWEIPNIIRNSIIEISAESHHDFEKVFSDLNKLLCRNILLLFRYAPTEKIIKEILEEATRENITYIEIWAQNFIKTKKITGEFKNLRKIVFINSKKKREKKENSCIIKYSAYKSFEELCEKTPLKYYATTNFYNESLKFNSCLNRKLSIDKNRKIKNCPFLNFNFGDYNENNILKIVNSEEFQKLWYINKDKINECKECQYRYICPDCRAFTKNNQFDNKPRFCSFDTHTAKY